MTTKKIIVNTNNITVNLKDITEDKEFYNPAFTITTGIVYASKNIIPTVEWKTFTEPFVKLFICEYCDTFTNTPGNCKNCGAPVVIYRE